MIVLRFIAQWRSALAAGEPAEMEARVWTAQRDYRSLLVRNVPLRDGHGEIVKWYGTGIDIEDRKRAEESLRKAQADLAHANRVTTMGELSASLAHEINQPISGAITNASTCLRRLDRAQPDLEGARVAASRVIRDANRAAEIIDRVKLLFSKGVAAKERLDVNEVIREMEILLHTEASPAFGFRPDKARSRSTPHCRGPGPTAAGINELDDQQHRRNEGRRWPASTHARHPE